MLALVTALAAACFAAALVGVLLPSSTPSGVARSLELVRTSNLPELVPLAEQGRDQRVWRPLLAALARLGARITPVGTPARLRRRLDLAGNLLPWTMDVVLVGKAVGTVVLGGLGLVLGVVNWLAGHPVRGLITAVFLGCLGYWLIDLLLYNAGQKRQQALRRTAPDALDMLTVCVEAGLGLDAGLLQVAENTRGPLASEFARALKEIQLGRSRIDAFSDLARRTNVDEVASFVSALVQADRLGVPVAAVLREQSAELRVRRRQRAEETAQKIPVKIVFPVLFCIFPVFFIIVIGPGAIHIVQAFSHG